MKFYKDKFFWAVFAALSLVKLSAFVYLFFFHPLGEQVLVFPDSLTYVYPAQTLLSYGTFWEAVSATPMLLRTPGYPLFLALIQLLGGNLTWSVGIAQNILSLFLLIPVYLIALQLGNKTSARTATAFCAASTLYFTLSFAVLTEMLCVFLLAWFVFFSIRFLQQFQGRDLFLSALLLASAVYVRPAAYYFTFVSTLFLAGGIALQKINFPLGKMVTLFVVPLVIMLGAWHLRNYQVARVSSFTTVGAFNLYVWNEDYLARNYKLTSEQAREMLRTMLPAGFDSLPPVEQAQIYKQLAGPLIRESFLYKLSRAPVWLAKTLFGPNRTQLIQLLNISSPAGSALVSSVAAGQVFLTVFFGILGLWMVGKTHRKEGLFLALFCCYFWGIGSVFFGSYARFRAPFEFVLCIAAGLALAHWLSPKDKI